MENHNCQSVPKGIENNLESPAKSLKKTHTCRSLDSPSKKDCESKINDFCPNSPVKAKVNIMVE